MTVGRALLVFLTAVVLAALSLALPWALAFDPMAWVLWGREITRGTLYTSAGPSGSVTFTQSDLGKLAPGRYRATLMLDDGYSLLADTTFRVR